MRQEDSQIEVKNAYKFQLENAICLFTKIGLKKSSFKNYLIIDYKPERNHLQKLNCQ